MLGVSVKNDGPMYFPSIWTTTTGSVDVVRWMESKIVAWVPLHSPASWTRFWVILTGAPMTKTTDRGIDRS